jgi:hypothetical protein
MKTKYPRTPHLPWSEGATSDDRVLTSVDHFNGMEVVVTEKMDGENTTMYREGIHARSLDSAGHPSRNWVKSLWGGINTNIPVGWRVCGENLYAKHSIHYMDLASYFMVFSIWDDANEALGWDETVEWCDLIGLIDVSVIDRVTFNVNSFTHGRLILPGSEGYVIRNAGRFHFDHFSVNVAKYVRPNHVQSDNHWMSKTVVPNILVNNNG